MSVWRRSAAGAGLALLLMLAPVSATSERAAQADLAAQAAAFRDLVASAGLLYEGPAAGFVDAAVEANPLWAYEHALRRTDASLEIRFAVRPLASMEIAYDDPHGSAPKPDHIFPMMFQTLIGLLSDGRHSPSREYPPDQARALFRADWAAAALFDLDPRFGGRYRHGLLFALHKNQTADAYTVYLFDDYETAKPLIDSTLGVLRFLP